MCIRDSPDTRIDLCGIAKGVCIDWIAAALKTIGIRNFCICLLYTSDAADERSSVDLGGRRIIKKKKNE